jgi:hypothetical protein
MRIPYPERLKWKNVFLYVVVLFIAQLATGTDVRFAGLVGLFTVLMAAAFNQAGGLMYVSGAYIFFNAVLLILFGTTYKVFLLQPGESHLLAPYTTMMVYCGGMVAMWGAVWATKRLSPKHGLLSSIINPDTMMQSAFGCLILGTVLALLFSSSAREGGTVGAALAATNRFPQFAIMLATVYEIRKSGGRRAWNWLVIVQVMITFAYGVIYTSKEGMLLGPVTWAFTAVSQRFDFKPKLLLLIGLFTFFMLYYMVPYSQYVRTFRDKDESRVANQATALEYIFRLGEVRELYKDAVETSGEYTSVPHYFNSDQGLVDRLTAISMDDALIDRTQQGFVFGLYPTYHGVINLVPTIIWKNKPFFFTGNEYGRELSVISQDDTTTGISFSPQADAYHEAKWVGIFLVMPLICFVYFLANDSFVGSVKDSPWPLLPIVLASHLAPEGGLDSMLLQVGVGSIGILFMAVVIRYGLPLVVRIATGGEKTVVRKSLEFRPRPILRPRDQPVTVPGSNLSGGE